MTAWLLAMRSLLFFYTVIMPQGDNWRQLGACRAAVPHRTPEDLKPAYHQIFGGLTVDKKCFYIAFQKKFFNPPNSPAVYLLLLAPESDGKGARA